MTMDDSNNDDNIIRSKESIHPVYLMVKNTTNRIVDVYWIDYNGELELYNTMDRQGKLDLDTFVSHPWVFVDANTGEQMRINGQTILWPLPLIVRTVDNVVVYRRKRYEIHLPMRTLQMNALWKIFGMLHTERDIQRLEIPNNLVIELEKIFKIYKDHRARRDNHPEVVDDAIEDDGDEEWEDQDDEDVEGENIEDDDVDEVDYDDDEIDYDDEEVVHDEADMDDFSEEEWLDVQEPENGDIVVHDGSSPQPPEPADNRINDNNRIL